MKDLALCSYTDRTLGPLALAPSETSTPVYKFDILSKEFIAHHHNLPTDILQPPRYTLTLITHRSHVSIEPNRRRDQTHSGT
jgi:hypothetical protein